MPEEEKYDSTKDSIAHMDIIKKVGKPIVEEFNRRVLTHDFSKLKNPERACYDKYIPLLKTAKYGTPEYNKIRENMAKEGLEHHYKENRHHPEHFEHGIQDMNLVDMLEMLCDWYAASLRSDTGFEEGFNINCKKFHISDDLKKILWNTYLYYIRKKRTDNK